MRRCHVTERPKRLFNKLSFFSKIGKVCERVVRSVCCTRFCVRVSCRSRASCTPSAHRHVASSCFSIDLFALQPSFTICDQSSLQLQTTYACACSNTHTHTPARLAAPPGSHTPWRTDVSKPVGKRGGEVLFSNFQMKNNSALASVPHTL